MTEFLFQIVLDSATLTAVTRAMAGDARVHGSSRGCKTGTCAAHSVTRSSRRGLCCQPRQFELQAGLFGRN